jgi:protein tyrosine/serine phosphatase
MTRHIALEGIDNFRDFGGYQTSSGRQMKRGRLYRSAAHGRATDADLDAIAALGISVVVDLRRPGERELEPSRRHHAFAGAVMSNDAPEREEDSWRAHIRQSDLSEAAFHDYMHAYYRNAPFEPRHVDLFSRYFAALARTDGAILIHCAAGKDRTGLLAALTHHIAGVHADDLLADYLLTNDPGRLERSAPDFTRVITEISGRVPSPGAVRVAMSVEADYLHTAFAAITSRHGGLDDYLEDVLGVDSTLREMIETRLLV